jgi:outer membrane protein assembly factor BamB
MRFLAFGMLVVTLAVLGGTLSGDDAQPAASDYDPTALALAEIAAMDVGEFDWPQWGGWSSRNNTPQGENIPTEWDIETGENILWSAPLGSQTYGNTVVANGKLYIGTNNGYGYIPRYPKDVDLGCLLCFNVENGEFLWQHSSPKLPTGRVHDWPDQGICSAVFADGDKIWYVTSRGTVCCLDAEGFHDGENDAPYTVEDSESTNEADVIWQFDMMGELGVSQHNMCSCSCTAAGDILFVCTSNGVDESHINIPAPNAPSFMAMNKNTGEVIWTDKSPGINIVHGQWTSPTYSVINDVPQVLFGGGDGFLYSFTPEGDGNGNSVLLWKFDCNPKEAKFILGGRGTRNDIIGTPVVYEGLVYLAVGQDPEHGEGVGHLWCIDPTKSGDVSPTLAVDSEGNPLPHRRIQAVNPEAGEQEIPNPNSALVWEYSEQDQDGNGEIDWEEEMHRSVGTVAIKNDILFIADFSGLFHCLDAKTGKVNWTYDMFAASWGSPLIVEDKVYIGDEEGDVTIFELSTEQNIINEIAMDNSVYSTPIVANNVLYISNKDVIYAIAEGASSDVGGE